MTTGMHNVAHFSNKIKVYKAYVFVKNFKNTLCPTKEILLAEMTISALAAVNPSHGEDSYCPLFWDRQSFVTV